MKRFFIALAKFIGYGGAKSLLDPARVEGDDSAGARALVIEGKRKNFVF